MDEFSLGSTGSGSKKGVRMESGPYSASNLALATQRVSAPTEKGPRGAGLQAIRPLGVGEFQVRGQRAS